MWCPGWDPGAERGYYVKNKEIQINSGLQLIIRYRPGIVAHEAFEEDAFIFPLDKYLREKLLGPKTGAHLTF